MYFSLRTQSVFRSLILLIFIEWYLIWELMSSMETIVFNWKFDWV
jgi:hypothetical protein